MSLAQEIKNRLANKQTAAAPVASQTQQAARQLQTRATGKASAPAPRISNIAEQTAQAQAAGKSEQLRQQQMMGAERLEGQEVGVAQKLEEGKKDLAASRQQAEEAMSVEKQMRDNARLFEQDEAMAKLGTKESMALRQMNAEREQTLEQLASQRNTTLNDIFSSFERSDKELAFRKDAAELEQLAHNMRLSDRQYVDQLARIGKMRDLEDRAKFKREAMELAFGEETLRILGDEKFKTLMAADTGDFMRAMSDLKTEHALEIAKAEAKEENAKAMASGITSVATAAIGGDS